MSSKVYVESILEEELILLAKNLFKNGLFTFTQNGSPSYTSKISQKWCKDNLPGFLDKKFWPSFSPDINTLEFSLWPILERNACVRFKECPCQVPCQFGRPEGLPGEGVGQDLHGDRPCHCDAFWRHVEVIIQAKEGHVDYKFHT